MKKLILSISALFLSIALIAQESSPTGVPIKKEVKQPQPFKAPNHLINYQSNNRMGPGLGTIIGYTNYDLQTNSAVARRIVAGPNDTLAATWTGSNTSGSFPDRGTFYNYYNGTSWSVIPNSRLENVRTGWPDNVVTSTGKQVVISHDPASYHLVQVTAPDFASGNWSQTLPNITGIWPRIAVGGPNNQTIHLINAYVQANPDPPAYTAYSRSKDEGQTWDIKSQILTDMDSAHSYASVGGDVYSIDANGSTVAIVSGNSNNPLAIWKSTDNGDTWTRTEAWEHPIENMDGNQISDVDGDNVPDTIMAPAADHHVYVDDNGKVHIWGSVMNIYDDQSGDGTWNIFLSSNGVYYWNEDMPKADSLNDLLITGALDINGNDTLDVTGFASQYGIGIAGLPSATMDTSKGIIFMTYSAVVENTGDPSENNIDHRDLYGMYSFNGVTWSEPVNLTNSATSGFENAYGALTRYTKNNKLRLEWQQDTLAGISISTQQPDHAVIQNDIRYAEIDENAFDTTYISANFGINYTCGGLVNFIDSSESAAGWYWDFGDGNTSNQRSPSHFYTKDSTYRVELIVRDLYGSDTIIDSITVTGSGFASTSNDTIVCYGGSVQISASGGVSYQWSPGASLSCTNCQTPTASPTSDTRYAVIVTDGSNCKDIDSVFVDVIQPTVNATANKSVICDGDSVQLNSTANAASYQWDPSAPWLIDCDTCQDPIATPDQSGHYKVTITDTNGCTAKDSVYISWYSGSPIASFDTLINGKQVDVVNVNNSSNYTALNWDMGDGNTYTNTSNFSHTYPSYNTTYTITLTAMNPCDTVTLTKTLTTGDSTTAIKELAEQSINVYPNPNKGLFYINIGEINAVKDGRIEVYNLLGEQVKAYPSGSLRSSDNLVKIDMNDQPNGVYFIRVHTEKGVYTRKVTLAR